MAAKRSGTRPRGRGRGREGRSARGEGCPVLRGERYGRTLIISPLTPRRRSLYPLPHESATHPHEPATHPHEHRQRPGEGGLETNLSFSFPLALLSHTISLLSLSFSVCLSVCLSVCRSLCVCPSVCPSVYLSLFLSTSFSFSYSFSRSADFPEFRLRTSLPLPRCSLAPLCPTGNRFFDGVPTAGLSQPREWGEGGEEGVCNVFATYFISSTHLCNYYCIKKPSATSRQRQLHYLRTRYLHCITSAVDIPNSSGS